MLKLSSAELRTIFTHINDGTPAENEHLNLICMEPWKKHSGNGSDRMGVKIRIG